MGRRMKQDSTAGSGISGGSYSAGKCVDRGARMCGVGARQLVRLSMLRVPTSIAEGR